MSHHVYHDPREVSLASVPVGPVSRIGWEIHASQILHAGDDDYLHSVARHSRLLLRGTLEMVDLQVAGELAGARGTLSFLLSETTSPKRVEISDCSFGQARMLTQHRDRPICKLEFLAESLPVFSPAT
jgi:hypothetical protein